MLIKTLNFTQILINTITSWYLFVRILVDLILSATHILTPQQQFPGVYWGVNWGHYSLSFDSAFCSLCSASAHRCPGRLLLWRGKHRRLQQLQNLPSHQEADGERLLQILQGESCCFTVNTTGLYWFLMGLWCIRSSWFSFFYSLSISGSVSEKCLCTDHRKQ